MSHTTGRNGSITHDVNQLLSVIDSMETVVMQEESTGIYKRIETMIEMGCMYPWQRKVE